MKTTSYEVKTSVFEGPLEVLLQLIEKRKLFINDISLAQVADDYIVHVRGFEKFPLGDAAGFVLVASILVLIKSKSLLPKLDLSEEEEQSIDELERRLKEHKRMQELSVHVSKRFGKQIIFPRIHVSKHIQPIFAPEKSITRENMLSAVYSAMSKVPRPKIVPKRTLKKVVSLEEMIDSLSERITRNIQMSFTEFSGNGKAEKITVVVSFLAMLELVKQGVLLVKQESFYEEISMETNIVQTPQY
ncbi:MAG: segregation/condensation protein A [Candidatus Pacebacteria bacterium]|nr:segregation/condensation protein A [Candidatus Paceibacterota bacterium]